jgi:hypothetical protein
MTDSTVKFYIFLQHVCYYTNMYKYSQMLSHHDIAEILLKVALNTNQSINNYSSSYFIGYSS